MKPSEYEISSEKFVLANKSDKMHDKELDTKPIGYFKDAFNRFKKNKGSIVAAIIIGVLILFAIIGPLVSPYQVSDKDGYYAYCLPKSHLSTAIGWDFWDGCENVSVNEQEYLKYKAMGEETGYNPIKNGKYSIVTTTTNGKTVKKYQIRRDSYYTTGVIYKDLTQAQYDDLQAYQDAKNIQVIYPALDRTSNDDTLGESDKNDANYWFKTKVSGGITNAVLDSNGNFQNVYKTVTFDSEGERRDGYTSKMKIASDTNGSTYAYAKTTYSTDGTVSYRVRVSYTNYYIYYHSTVLNDGVSSAVFLFGTTNAGQDIFTALSSGARFSFLLAIIVSTVNLFVGAIYGAIEGYYGGKVDLIMERISDILSAVPFMIVITLLKYYMNQFQNQNTILILFIAFFLTGWIGMAGSTRMQFYRFKNQEYVLAARTLGASDKRIMFKHIFPNALGTLVTSCVLVIPSTIFSETSLSYLGIINLDDGKITSVGTLLANAQTFLVTYPHMIVFPALFISLLMLSFNLFGNGLRDAFNPSLRGSED